MRKRVMCVLLAAVLLLGTVVMAIPEARAQSDLHTSQALVDLLISFEGFTGKCVVDGSQRSVGYGTRCDVCDSSMPGYLDPNRQCAAYTDATPISKEHAMELKMKFLSYFEEKLNAFADKHGLTFTQNQFDGLISLTYNCGYGWTLEENGILRDAVIKGDMGDYLVYAFGLYSKSGKTVSLPHIRRRMIEAEVYLHGVYEYDWPENLRYVYLDANGGQTKYYYQTFDASQTCPIRAEITQVPKGTDGKDLTFAGWFTQSEGGKQVENLTNVLTNGMVLYAHWTDASGQTVTVNTDTSMPADVWVVVPQWWPNTLYEGPGKFYSEVRKTTFNEQLHITKTVTGKDGNQWGYCADGWIPLADTNYSSVVVTPTPGGTWYTVTADLVNVRIGPDTVNAVVGTKSSGAQVQIMETQENAEDNQTWGKLPDGNWICIRNGQSSNPVNAVVMDPQPTAPVNPTPTPVSGVTITGITISALPTVREYPVGGLNVLPDLSGSEVTISYSNNSKKYLPITRSMVSGFDNSQLGTVTITVTVGGKTATFDVEIIPTKVTGIALQNKPTKTEYLYQKDALDVTGGELLVTYDQNQTRVVPISADMVTGFNNGMLGTNTLTVTYGGFTATFDVTIINPVVTFLNYDGSVISQTQYSIGAAVTAPAAPAKPADSMGEYVFAGWDREVVACAGNATYTATFKLKYAMGDLDRNGKVDEKDAVYLLWHVFFPKEYPVYAWADFDKSGTVDEKDGVYLLWHTFYPEDYPLS